MQLRDYQIEATHAVYNWFAKNKEGNPLVVLPTASGKSVCIAELIRSAISMSSTQRFLVLTHAKELIQQNHDKLKALYPNAPAGIYSAGIGIKEPKRQIVFAGIQSVRNKAHVLGHRDLVIIDECHSIPNKTEGTYHAFFNDVRAINPKVRFIGYTATPFRMKGGHLLNGDTFHDVAFELPIRKLLEDGYLCPVFTKAPEDMQVSMEGVRINAGEYNQKAMQQRYMEGDITALALRDALDRATDRKCFLIFCAGVEHAKLVHELMQSIGMKGNVVYDKTPSNERDNSIEALRNGEYDYLSNNAVLTTGTDIPPIDCIIILRSMKSRGLYIQIVGRMMRLHTNKQYGLLLDYGGNVDSFGAIDQQPMGKKAIDASNSDSGDAPFKRCNVDNVDNKIWKDKPCGGISHATAKQCELCGAPFIQKEKHDTIAAQGSIITPDKPVPTEHRVTKVIFAAHIGKTSGLETLRISYYNGISHICDEYKGLQKIYHTMTNWFNGEKKSFPTIKDAIKFCTENAIKPTTILTIPQKDNNKYLQVIGYGFATA